MPDFCIQPFLVTIFGLVLICIWFCGLAISCHVVFYVGHLSAFVASFTGQGRAAGRWMARLADTALPFILQSSRSWGRRRRRNEWTEKEEHLTANGREGVKERGEQTDV